MRNDDMDGTILRLRKGLRLDAGFNLAVYKVLDEGTNVLLGECLGLVEGEFLVLNSFLDGECGPLVDLKVKVASVGTESFGVNGCEVDNALVLLSEGLEDIGEFFALFRGLGEDVGKGNTGLSKSASGRKMFL